MNEPVFLEIDQILKIHDRSIAMFGGSSGIRDQGLLEGSVMQPRNDFYYGGADLYGVAAAYAFHLAEVQSFLDGNKRTAISAALLFLEMHGIDTSCDWKILHAAMISIAEKKSGKSELASLFRELFTRNVPR